ncbi:MAG TPA: serine hydrolase domain-containing protein [Vicinamibacterales bacterium]|nr:serine hydrolase domain-containing protein [Vicinamibacterales bacterium]
MAYLPLAAMKRPLVFLTLAVSAVMAVSLRAADSLVIQRFSDYIDALRIQTGIPGLSATIVSATDVAWEQGFGLADVARNIHAEPTTLYQVDGLTQTLVASLALRCDESGFISLNDPVSKYVPGSPDGSSTLRMLLTHTSPGAGGLTFAYRLDRLAPLAPAEAVCTDGPFRAGIAALLDRMGMSDSVPGADAATPAAAADGISAAAIQRYAAALGRLAVPYTVDGKGKPSIASYSAPTLTPSAGLVTTSRDLAKFDVALKNGVVMRAETLAAAWTPPIGANGAPLPHGVGWFEQGYNGEPIVWQFGQSGVSSSMVIIAPRRSLTLIMLANSAGLTQGLNLAAGDLNVSPFARVFLGLFVR